MYTNPDWGYLEVEDKKKIIDKIKTDARKQAREELFGTISDEDFSLDEGIIVNE